MNPARELPESTFWQYSIALYARPGVAAACLALQDREKADVNLILLAFWLASRGHRLSTVAGRRLARRAREWQLPIVAPLRQVRRQLKRRSDLPWPEPIAAWRRSLAELELGMEQVEQLLLESAVGPFPSLAADAGAVAPNLVALGLTHLVGTEEVALLLRTADVSGRRSA